MNLPSTSLMLLYEQTQRLFSDADRITRALDWVDQVLPAFLPACRHELQSEHNRSGAIPLWKDWLESDAAHVIAEAGKGEVFRWRIEWLRILLEATVMLGQAPRDAALSRLADLELGTWRSGKALPPCFPDAFWRDMADYFMMASNPVEHEMDTTDPHARRIIFPLVLSEPVVDAGSETNVILAQFLFEPSHQSTGSVFLHPEHAALRCMDKLFAASFAHAAAITQKWTEASGTAMPGVRVQIRTVVPGHERFLSGVVLRGSSAGGALAVGLSRLYSGEAFDTDDLAVSFALAAAGDDAPNGRCHSVSGTDDKVRACAKQGIKRLLVAKEQQSSLVLYGHKHGVEIIGAEVVEEAVRALVPAARSHEVSCVEPKRIVLAYHRRAAADVYVSKLLEAELVKSGNFVFIDRHLPVGIAWAREIERQIQAADAVIPLLSSSSIASDMLASEMQIAHEARQRQQGRPRLLPIRIDYTGPLPERIRHILGPLQQATWCGRDDDNRLVDEIEFALRCSDAPSEQGCGARADDPIFASESSIDMEPFDGLVPLGSRYYIERGTDRAFLTSVEQRHSVILVKGSRQMGKSSLLARGLHQAEKSDVRVGLTDLQKLNVEDFTSLQSFYLAVARMLARQLDIPASLDETWVPGRSANLNFEEYLEDYVLSSKCPLIWAIDEADRLFFACPFGSEVFGLIRSWANERQGRPNSPWTNLTMAIAYATEAHLFITDINQSPFNIGTRFELKDFTMEQVQDLNQRYGSPIDDADMASFYALLGGHPYLVRRGLYALRMEGLSVPDFEKVADRDDGPIGDHLRRIITLLARNADQFSALQEILLGKPCPTFESFYHLRSAGIIVGDSIHDARVRCDLYTRYLKRHLS
jgi:hypothetical protein